MRRGYAVDEVPACTYRSLTNEVTDQGRRGSV